MADHTITAGARGAYEFPVAADAVVTVDVEADPVLPTQVEIIVHTATASVYAKRGTTIEPRDPDAVVIPAPMIAVLDLHAVAVDTIAITSQADAIVSVARP